MSRRPAATALAALVIAVLLAGCGDLETAYGARGIESVNGADVLHARLSAAVPTTVLARLSPRAEERDLLVHLARDNGLPDTAACDWIRTWLEDREERQFVLVLRDGAVGAWLCDRWAAEARVEAARRPEQRAALEQAATRLEERAELERERDLALVAAGQTRTCDLFTVSGREPAAAAVLSGWWSGPAPLPMRVAAVPSAPEAETMVSADGQPWAIAVPIGDSRLIVVAGATALLDATQVDHHARALTAALIRGVTTYGSPSTAAWVERLTVRGDEDPEPPNILALLFGTPPFSWVAFHLLALVLVFLAWKATWLGRTEAPRERHLERFSRHVDALALHLRQARALRAVVDAIAKALGRAPPPAAAMTPPEAFAAVQQLYRPETRAPVAQEPA